MRRVFNDALISAGAVTALLLALVAIDDRVRSHVALALREPQPSAKLAMAGEVASTVLQAVRVQSIDHAPLMIFALAGGVLVLFMLRT
jgi:hypothetical protein